MAKNDFRVVVVGASSGIGRALALALASRGVKVGVASRNAEALKELKQQYPENVCYEVLDINRQDAPDLLSRLIERLGGMNLYIHASGIGYANPGLNPKREAEIVETNSVGFARMVSAAYRYFRGNGLGGQIVGISSVAGTKGMADMAAYSASKAFDQAYLTAIDQLSHREHTGVTVTDIRPGWIRTPLLKEDPSKPLEMKLDYVLPKILKAIARRKRVAVVDWKWGIVESIFRALPTYVWVKLF